MTDQAYTTGADVSIALHDLEFFVGIVGSKLKRKDRRACIERMQRYAGPDLTGSNIHRLRGHDEAMRRAAAISALVGMLGQGK